MRVVNFRTYQPYGNNQVWGWSATLVSANGSVRCLAPAPAFKDEKTARKWGNVEIRRIADEEREPLVESDDESEVRASANAMPASFKLVVVYSDGSEVVHATERLPSEHEIAEFEFEIPNLGMTKVAQYWWLLFSRSSERSPLSQFNPSQSGEPF